MRASPSEPVLVHFPHRGLEHKPPRGVQRYSWSIKRNHARKFLCSPGRYVAPDRSFIEAPLAFWGEWEAPSYVRKCWPEDGELPRYLHEPVWEYPKINGFRQNTDPWVFGDCFRYSNCFQTKRKSKTDSRRRETALQHLTSGSLILFGSKSAAGGFALDTVFVVSEELRRFRPVVPHEIDEVFRVCTIESLEASGDGNTQFTLYSGATYEYPVNGMYSFVPSRRADHDGFRFARPAISLAGEPMKGHLQSPKGASTPRSLEQIRACWESVREQVCAKDCLIGVHFSTPPLDDANAQ
jgi:hypothetical protein